MLISKLFILTFLTLIYFNSSYYLNTNDTVSNTWINYLTYILQRFEYFHIIFHCYNANTTEVNILSQNINVKNAKSEYWPIFVYNYNTNKIFRRPNVSQIVHVIYDFDEELTNILASSNSIHPNDVIIFLSKFEIRNKITSIGENFIKIGGKTLLIQLNQEIIKIYKICFYCGEKSKKFELLQSSEHINKEIKNSSLLPSKFANLNGHIFYFCFIQYFPLITCKSNATRKINKKIKNLSNVECTNISGIEGNLLQAVSKYLNLTYKIFFMSPEAGWFNMIELVHNNEIDIAIGGISITVDRVPLVQFTKLFNFENFNFLYVFDLTFQDIFDNFISPFSAGFVWSLFFGTFFVLSVSLYITFLVKVEDGYGRINLSNSLWVSTYSIFI